MTFLDKPPSAWVVLAKPDLGISSPDVFKALNLNEQHVVYNDLCKQALKRMIINCYVKAYLID